MWQDLPCWWGRPTCGAARAWILPGRDYLCSRLFWALGSVISHKLSLPPSPLLAAATEMLAGGGLLLLLGVLSGEGRQFHFREVAAHSVLGFVYLIGAGSLVGFTAYIWLLRNVPTARLSTYAFVNPAVALFLGWAVGSEGLTGRELLASATIIAGVALIITHRPRPAPVTLGTEGLRTEKPDSRK